MKKVIIISGSYIAALIGAGFASGGEIAQFFVRSGKAGFIGILAASAVFSVFAYLVLTQSAEAKTQNYDEYLKNVMPGKLRCIVRAVTVIFAFIVFSVMCAGGAELARTLFGVKASWGALFVCIMSALLLSLKNERLLKINGIIGIAITVMTVYCLLHMIYFREQHTMAVDEGIKSGALGLVYSGYNVLTAGAVLCALSRDVSKKQALCAGILSGVMMCVMMILIWGMVGIYYNKIPLGEMPMMTLAIRENMETMYSILIFAALLTTAFSNGMVVTDALSPFMSRNKAALLTAAAGYLLSGAGFLNLINSGYRICGIIGIFLPVYLFIKNIKILKNKEK